MSKSEAKVSVRWLDEPAEHDYPTAASFLLLLKPQEAVDELVRLFRAAPVVSFKSKDIFRESGLSMLGVGNSHVDVDRQNIPACKPLSPIPLVRDAEQERVVIADGYHRLCALYSFDEDASMPCKIV